MSGILECTGRKHSRDSSWSGPDGGAVRAASLWCAPMEVREATVPDELAGMRLDLALTQLFPGWTRARCQRLIAEGRVSVGGRTAKSSSKVRAGQALRVEAPPPEPSGLVPQDLPL